MPPTRAGLIATRYSLLSTRSSTERSSVRAFVRITSAASSRESPPTSVSHTNASMPSVAPIPKTNRRSSGSGMRPFRGERASSIHPIRRPRRSGRLSPRHYRDPWSTAVRGGEGGVCRESQSLECRKLPACHSWPGITLHALGALARLGGSGLRRLRCGLGLLEALLAFKRRVDYLRVFLLVEPGRSLCGARPGRLADVADR